ncbi:MAG: hypothetical protein Metus_0231 [Candidatus Methanosuratincola subterraneus]|uniref:Uncharacterized protein n=1 Tax=Methanosuratincola subterraneus TaxID=2593994 RepID=A0A3S3TTC1_METS7|nr:MAG: hypothetical protein Metus_0231 [Candidatus Methanosuratincola subterraneus]
MAMPSVIEDKALILKLIKIRKDCRLDLKCLEKLWINGRGDPR